MKKTVFFSLLLALSSALFAQTPVEIVLDTVSVPCDTTNSFLVGVRTKGFNGVAAFQFSINWDITKLQYEAFQQVNPAIAGGTFFNPDPGNGRISALWTVIPPTPFINLPDGTLLFNLRFKRKSGGQTPIVFSNIPTAIGFFDTDLLDMPWDTTHGWVRPVDNTPPVLTCPANLTVQAAGPAPVSGIAPASVSDDCALQRVGWSSTGATVRSEPNDPDASGAVFNPGVSVVQYTAEDAGGLQSTCSFSITLEVVNLNPSFQLGIVETGCSTQVAIPITAQAFDSLFSVSFSHAWNPGRLQFDSVGGWNPVLGLNLTNFDVTAVTFGQFGFEWTATDTAAGATLPNGAVLYRLYFTPLINVGNTATIAFSDQPNTRQVRTSKVTPPAVVPATYETGSVTIVDILPPIVECINSATAAADPATFTATISGLQPINLSDDCSSTVDLAYTLSGATTGSGSGAADGIYAIGVTTVSYLATDQSGNTSTCSFPVTVTGNLPLTFILDTVNTACGSPQVEINVTVRQFVDIIGANFSIVWDPAVLGFDTVFNDFPGLNLTPASFFNFQTTPNGRLNFLAGNPITGWPNIPDDGVFFTLRFDVLGASSQIGFVQPIDAVDNSFNSVPVLTIDGFFSQTGLDQQPPVVVCPTNVSVDVPGQSTSATVTGLAPLQLSDDCSTPVLTYTQSGATTGMGTGVADGLYNVGVTTVTYTATDGVGQSATCSFTVTVDSDVLTIRLDNLNISCGVPNQQVEVNVTVEDFRDLLGMVFSVNWDNTVLSFVEVKNTNPLLGLTPADFQGFVSTPDGILRFLGGNPVTGWPALPDGDTMFTIVFTVLNPNAQSFINFIPPFDAVNSAFNSVPLVTIDGSFTIVDDTPPVFANCPPLITATAPMNSCSTAVSVTLPTATDACSGIQSVLPTSVPGVYPVGNTTLNFVATDLVGNTASCSIVVQVSSSSLPQVVSCPSSISIDLPTDKCEQAVSWTVPQFVDPCPGPGLVITSTHLPGQIFQAGTTNVVYTATDASGGQAQCSFTITLRDIQPPFILCQPDMMEPANPSLGCAAIVFFGPAFTSDFCDLSVTLTADAVSGSVFQAGDNVVTFTAVDDAGNSATCSFTITVVDSDFPVFDCPSDTILQADPALQCAAVYTFTQPVVTDACDPNPVFSSSIPSGSVLPIGPNVVEFTGRDGFGNTTVCSFVVTVQDVLSPTIICPSNIAINSQTGLCGATATWAAPQVSDDCDPSPSVTANFNPGSFFPVGVTTVNYTAQDNFGNPSTCSFTVEVIDQEAPVFPNGCPSDLSVIITSGCDANIIWAAPLASDNCAVNTLVSAPASGTTFVPGVYGVVFTATDNAGNTATCNFSVTVMAGQQTSWSNVPDTIVVTVFNSCDTAVTWAPPQLSNPCDVYAVTPSIPPGAVFQLGATNVVYTGTDQFGKAFDTAFVVVVREILPPVFTLCPAGPVVVNTAGIVLADPDGFLSGIEPASACATAMLEFGLLQATDNCSVPVVVQDQGPPSGAEFDPGNYTIAFTATDAQGNTAACAIDIVVEGFMVDPPIASPNPACNGSVVTLSVTDIPGATYAWTGPAMGYPDTSQITIPSFSVAASGTYSVVVSANGCQSDVLSVDLLPGVRPVANPDSDIFVYTNSTSDTINVLLNDVEGTGGSIVNVVFPTPPPPGLQYHGNGQFTFDAGARPEFVSFIYEVCSATCPDLCDQAEVTIAIIPADCGKIPNIITPNGDGVNDYLVIPCLYDPMGYPKNSIVVYNIWGDKVYEASPYTNDKDAAWQGTLNGDPGKPLPDGTYYYLFNPGNGAKPTTGFVEIYR